MMKPATFILGLLLLITNSGFALHLHFCLGELEIVSLEAEVSCCDENESMPCCEDEDISLDLDSEFLVSNKRSNDGSKFVLSAFIPFIYTEKEIIHAEYEGIIPKEFPPNRESSRSIFILNKQLIFYA